MKKISQKKKSKFTMLLTVKRITHFYTEVAMKRNTIALLLFVLATIAAVAQPKLEIIGGETYDWGKVKPKDMPLKATLKFRNDGNQLLTIKEVKAGCGCTTTKVDKEQLKPGEIASVDVSVNVPGASGALSKVITVYCDDPAIGTNGKVIWLKAEVVRAIQLSQQYLAFNDLAIGKKSSSKITVKNNSSENVTFDGFEATNGVVLNQKKKIEIKPGAEFELEATYIPSTEGYFNAMVKFTTSSADFPTMEVSAYGNVMKPDSPIYQK